MFSAPSHDLGVVGWICLAAIWLGSVVLVCQTALTGLRLVLRFLERRHTPPPADVSIEKAMASARRASESVDRLERVVCPPPIRLADPPSPPRALRLFNAGGVSR